MATEQRLTGGGSKTPTPHPNNLAGLSKETQHFIGQEKGLFVEGEWISGGTSHGIYRAPRVFIDLREVGEKCSKHRVMRLMRVNKTRAARGCRTRHHAAWTPLELVPIVLQRSFAVSTPDEGWVTDITYIRAWEGRLYLAVVIDLFSRKIVGWSTKPTPGRELALDAILMAVRRRRPKRTIIPSDQGRSLRATTGSVSAEPID